MASELQKLRAASVTEVIKIHDYIQLVFSNAYRLSVYNDFIVVPEGRGLNELKSMTVDSVIEAESQVIIHFENGLGLSVCLSDECYHGPEAIQLNTRSGQIVIWN